jgi:Transglutaminase-like superfamily
MKHLRKLKALLQMAGSDRLHLFQVFLLLLLIRLGLGLLPFRVVLKQVQTLGICPGRSSVPSSHPAQPISHIVWLVNVSSRYMPGGVKCLARALTTQLLLTQQGYVSDLRIGVAKAVTGELEAHAWIEYQERIVIGHLNDLSRYIPFPSLEGIKL